MDQPAPQRTPLCPLYIDLTGRTCVVIGGGSLAERRVRSLLAGGADVRIVAPDLTASLRNSVAQATIAAEQREYRRGDLAGAFLAVASTGIDAVDEAVCADAASAGCLCNAVGDSALGDTIIPAEVRRGGLRIAVSSSGASPTVAAHVRRIIEDEFDDEWEPYLDALAVVRTAARERLDATTRRKVNELAARPELRHDLVAMAEQGTEAVLEWLQERCATAEGCSAGGFVSLVGAGPGDPGLITVKGMARLREADVVIQDHLADERLVAQAPAHAERIYVGKRGGHDYMRQERINELIVEKALEDGGKRVVRLKGGDPFVFGRGGEEALALLEAGVPFEIVSGVSSGHAVPAAAGIPVTHRGLSTSVAYVTGHEDPTKERFDVDWERLASAVETICIFMGVRNAETIASGLIAGGRSAEEPVAVVRWGTTPRQSTHVTTLGELSADVERLGIEPPALIVVGAVVSMRGLLGGDEAFA